MSKLIAPHMGQPQRTFGPALEDAKAAMILVHRRGGSGFDIFGFIGNPLNRDDIAYIAPEASQRTWYPYSFLAPMDYNEPGITSGIATLAKLVAELEEQGFSSDRIFVGGFSQGACLASEFVARNPKRYAGLFVFSGGLIGPPGTPRDYAGSLDGTPVFLGCSDVDFHIPVERVHETDEVLTKMGASVTKKIYPQMGHTIIQDEIDHAIRIIENALDNVKA